MTILDLIKKSAVMLNIRQVLDDDNIDNVDKIASNIFLSS